MIRSWIPGFIFLLVLAGCGGRTAQSPERITEQEKAKNRFVIHFVPKRGSDDDDQDTHQTGDAKENPVCRRVPGLNPNPALFGNRTETWAALGAEKVAEIQNGHTEETVVELLPRAELHEALRAGRISSALVVAALYWFELYERGSAR
jgi:hypothetical protein